MISLQVVVNNECPSFVVVVVVVFISIVRFFENTGVQFSPVLYSGVLHSTAFFVFASELVAQYCTDRWGDRRTSV